MRQLGWQLRPSLRLLAIGALAALCPACADSALEVEGKTPFVRCLAADPPDARSWQVAGLRLEISDRDLQIHGTTAPMRLAAFAGPGMGSAPDPRAIAALSESSAQLGLLLGGLGDQPQTAQQTLAALSKLPFPTLVLAGARDTLKGLRSALGAADSERLVDITALRSIRIAEHELIPVAGSQNGRGTLSDEGCGFGVADLKRMVAGLGPAQQVQRYLLAWETPGRGGSLSAGRTHLGVDVGSGHLEEFSLRVGARGGLFAFPHVQLLRPRTAVGDAALALGAAHPQARVVVPRVSGPAMERSDGTRVLPGFALVRLDASGLALEREVATVAIPPN